MGIPLTLVPLSSKLHEHRHQLYITERDNYSTKLLTPLPAYWYDNSLRFSAKVYEFKHFSSRSLSTKVRLIMDKGWHGEIRIKTKKESPEDLCCLLCKQDYSQAHWLHHCPHPPSVLLISGALTKITEHISASTNPRYGTSFRTLLMTITEPERVWTGNWSFPQIHHFAALLESAEAIPSTPCGLSALATEMLQLSRILSRTALQLWIVKKSI